MNTTPATINSASDPADVQVQAGAPPSMAVPELNGPGTGPDLSALARPGSMITGQAPPSMAGTSDLGPTITAQNNAQQEITRLNQPTTPNVGSHQKLFSIIQAIGVGLSNAGKAGSTGGREGGASGVIADAGAIQQQKINAQNAVLAQKNAAIQNQIQIIDTNHKLGQNILQMAAYPNEQKKSDLEISGETQRQSIVGAEFAKTNFGLTPDQVSGKAPLTPQNLQVSQNMLTRTIGDENRGALAILGKDDKAVVEAQRVAALPNPTGQEISNAGQGLITAQQQSAATTEAKTKQHAEDPLYKLESDPSQMEGAKSSSAISLLQNRLSTETDPQQKIRVTRLLAQANNAHAAWQADEKSKENAHLTAISGDPVANGQLLAEGDLTLADMKSRGSTTKSITDSVNAAKDYAKAHGKTYNASDEIVGEQALKGQTNQNCYGSARSLVQQGGMLDQLKTTHDNLGNTKVPGFNKIADWTKYQAGTPELSAYKQAVLAAADDYAKVMGGGNPTIEQFNALRDGFAYQLNNAQLDTAIDVARKSVRSQVEGRIGPNNYIRKRMGDILQDQAAPATPTVPAPAGSPASTIHANMGDFTHSFSGTKGTIYSDDGTTWFDASGKPVKGK